MHPAPSPRANAVPPGMPFTIGRPLRANEPIFGRDDTFRFIDSALASFSSVNIVGERRMGKTSLLAHLRDNPAYASAVPTLSRGRSADRQRRAENCAMIGSSRWV